MWGLLLKAAVYVRAGRDAQAIGLLQQAIATADEYHMALCAAGARWRLGELMGGDAGAAPIRRANEWLSGEDVVSPDRLLAVGVPGFDCP